MLLSAQWRAFVHIPTQSRSKLAKDVTINAYATALGKVVAKWLVTATLHELNCLTPHRQSRPTTEQGGRLSNLLLLLLLLLLGQSYYYYFVLQFNRENK